MDDYPGNSRSGANKAERPKEPSSNEDEVKKVRPVTQRPATRRKVPMGRKFMNTFFEGFSAQDIVRHVVLDVLLPDARAMIFEAGKTALERALIPEGHSLAGRSSRPTFVRPNTPTNYTRYSSSTSRPDERREMSRRARQQHDLDDIIISTRAEAEEVLGQLFEIIDSYDVVTVADFYDLVQITPTHTDRMWGWRGLDNADVVRHGRDGFRIVLPQPIPLNKD